jgi:hypothetical protein
MDNKPVTERCIELARIRAWIAEKLSAETDRKVRDSLFWAQQAVGSAMLHLERVEYRTGADNSGSVDQLQ